MTYFESYLLWNLGSFSGFFGILILLLITLSFVSAIPYWSWLSNTYYSDRTKEGDRYYNTYIEKRKKVRKVCIKCLIGIICCLFLITIIPNTETVFKIVATKKGVDALQSKEMTKVLERAGTTATKVNDVVDNSLNLLNEVIESKMKNKPVKKETTK